MVKPSDQAKIRPVGRKRPKRHEGENTTRLDTTRSGHYRRTVGQLRPVD